MRDVVNYGHMYKEPFKETVYLPSEDTFVFADTLLDDFGDILTRDITLALEIGSGSGYLSTFLVSLYTGKYRKDTESAIKTDESNSIPFVLTVDINSMAAVSTHKTAKSNGVSQYFDCLCSDMFTRFRKRRNGVLFDLILFNPPYVPSDSLADVTSIIDKAWYGGKDGREVIDKFILSVKNYLSEYGLVYILLEKQNCIQDVLELIKTQGFEANIVKTKKVLGETLSIIKFHFRLYNQTFNR